MSIDEDKLPRMISFPCRLQRGSIEHLSFQWFYANNTPIEVNLFITNIFISIFSFFSRSLSQLMEFRLRISHVRVI